MTRKMPENYKEAVAYIDELPKFTKKHSLEHTKEFLRKLGSPEKELKVIHVAGTNGKGSVCAYMQAILQAEGKQTGFFTSPHLVSINERIQINRRPIDDDTFYQVFCQVMKAAIEMEEEGAGHPSYFEFLYGMGMTAFTSANLDYVILETGLGGRLDATNSVESPMLSIITSISMDHTEILGDTLEKIAAEKAGIIKKGVPVFFDGSNENVVKVLKKTAEEKNAPCREISKNAFEIQEVQRNYIAFSRANAYDKDVIWKVPICGIYQVMNACLAIEASEYLLGKSGDMEEKWTQAVESMRWEGRMEEIVPHFTVDGAHNPGAIEAFVQSVHKLHPTNLTDSCEKLPVLIFSAVSDKKYEEMIAYICEHLRIKTYIVTEIEDKRRVLAEELETVFKKYTEQQVICKKQLKDAVEEAFSVRGESEIYCIGSLYLVGMVKKILAGGDDNA
ncbi:MAG: bifunctional folylpolyglutamate synthase/dihydrofolate synthase [Dorea sp.]